MTARSPGRGIFYGRRSTDQQESSLESQLDWAIRTAAADGISLDVTRELLDTAKAAGQSALGDLYVDDSVTGSNGQRAGWTACSERALADPKVSHIYVYHRDRIARPDDPAEAASKEYKLIKAGITIAFRDRKIEPTVGGEADLVHLLTAMLDYSNGHKFLTDLSNRVLESKRMLALQGFSAGGRAPYGFARFLKSPAGELTHLPDGRRVRQEGHHVVHLPHDREKIAIWLSILDMKERGLGFKRIANHLNSLGVPSPDAGRERSDGGVKHRVSGLWNARTIAELCRNPIISGILQLGTRSEGKHRRFTPTGSRTLRPDDHAGDKLKRIINPIEERIRVQSTFEPLISPDRFERIGSQIDSRGACQRGVPRAKDPGRYPLSTCVVDLSNGCGALMYGVPRQKTVDKVKLTESYYSCGRYLKTGDCDHNTVDGERLLAVALKAMKHMIRTSGTRSELVEKLEQLAERKAPGNSRDASQRASLVARTTKLSHERETIGKKLAVETDAELLQIFRDEFAAKGKLLKELQSQLASLPQETIPTAPNPSDVVNRALVLLDNLERLVVCPEARPRINAVLKELGVWIGLDFHAAKWGKRSVRRLRSGIITFGGYHLPVPLHGRDNSDHDARSIVGGCSTACQSAASVPASIPDDGSGKDAAKAAKVNEKDDSSTKGNRGDKI